MSSVEEKFEIVGEEAIRDPHSYFGRIRDRSPVVWDAASRSWLVTSYQHVTAALRNDAIFSSDRIVPFINRKLSDPDTDPKIRRAFEILADWLVFKDKPDHLRMRLLVQKAFSARSVSMMHRRINDIADDLLGRLPDEGEVNLLRDCFIPLSATVVSDILGVPPEDRGKFEYWQQLLGPIVGAGLEDTTRYDKLGQGMDDLLEYCQWLIQRHRDVPHDDFLTELIHAREDDQTLSEAEIISTCTLILFAGSETSANLMANAVRALLLHPDQMEMLRAQRITASQAVEEFQRFDGSGKAITRVVREDCDFFGHSFKKGQRVFLVLSSANHDPDMFEEPAILKLDRGLDKKHVGFGFGIHVCLGSPLARLETAVALTKVLERWRSIELAEPLEWHRTFLARGLKSLPLKVAR